MKGYFGRAACLGAGAMLAVPMAAMAFPFEYKGVEGNFDTTVSVGAAIRVGDPDPKLIGIANGGTSRSVNTDDGNLNYEKGEVYSATVKATHDLELKYANYGFFTRASYFYDAMADRKKELGPMANDRLAWDIDFLDLFAYGSFDLFDHDLDVRVGKQVINWGESSFISGGINSINAVDVAKLRTPGAEIKEALLPTSILSTSLQLTDTASVEALWIMSYDKTRIDPRGSYFSTADTISDDGTTVWAGFGRRNDQHNNFPVTADNTGGAGIPIRRNDDRLPEDKMGQYGVAGHFFAEALNSTEFGLYYLHYHSRAPLISAVRGTGSDPAAAPFPSTLTNGTTRFYAEYPEDIDMVGLSFNTNAPYGIAVQGEYSYRPNQPVQIASTELVLAALRVANNRDAAYGENPTTADTALKGYERIPVHQVQSTLTKAFGPTWLASQWTAVGEIGANYQQLPDNGLLFNGPATSLPAPGSQNLAGGSFQQEGYATRFSWGYRLVTRMDFEDVIGPVQVSPRLAFAHDVQGVSSTFNQGTMAATLGFGFNYLQRWQADLAYTNFFGGRTYRGTDPVAPPAGQSADFAESANPLKDRDFVSVNVSYAF